MDDKQRISWPGWEVIRVIGRGSFGSVYEIQRNVLGDVEKAALKVISIPQNESDIDEMYSDGYDDESITSTFRSHLKSIVAEYTLMRKLNGSTNIVNCDDIRYVQHDDGIGWDIFIKMELLTPLTKALPAEIAEESVEKLGKDMCAALVLCRKHGIIHRDIKPQNIFVSPNGDYKLGDFGIAKTIEKTTGGTKIGTYKYMAPEVYNNQPYGAAADIYSLGLVMYWMLNEHRMPFLPLPPKKLTSSMEDEARNQRFRGRPFPPPKNGSQWLKNIVMKACAFDPKERYSNAEQMLNDLLRRSASESDLEKLDIYKEITFEHDDNPAGKYVSVEVSGKAVRVLVPADVQSGQTIHIPGKGIISTSGARGDLYVTIRIKPKQRKQISIQKVLIAVAAVLVVILACMVIFSGKEIEGPKKPPTIPTEEPHVHSWVDATCTTPKTCYTCGEVSGTVLEHQWIEASYDAPKTCSVCGVEEGEKLLHEAVFLNELTPIEKYGKLWTSSERQLESFAHTDVSDGEAYEDLNTPGHTSGPVYDYRGNRYTYGLTVDGSELASYYVSYNIEGKYKTFSGTCSMSEDMDGNWRASYAKDGKYFDIYGDGKWLFRTNTMKQGEAPHSFIIDVTGVEILTIQYPKTSFPSRIATLFDGKLSNEEELPSQKDSPQNEKMEADDTKPVISTGVIAAGNYHSVYLRPDGTVYATGSNYLSEYDNKGTRLDVSSWTDIVAISASSHTVGLKADGTVVACGVNRYGQCDLSSWTDIIAICAGDEHTVGLRSDGTVVAKGNNKNGQCEVSHWSNIVAIAACNGTTFGLKSDGTIISAGQNNYGYSWGGIISICGGPYDLVGLRNDGTVVASGSCNTWDKNTIDEWENIVEVSASSSHIVGLKENGRVVACGLKRASEAYAVENWTDIVQVSAGMYFTIGLKSDGTVVYVGDNSSGQCNLG